ncbi:DNA-binding protein [Salinicoccus sp. ID82-1]|uniref:helix-turn-helix domain-containing protein n=1 Tax=Salinicoccus sp. ID82-1 TaxID=2820269 RepID=UPI001F1EC641|nr:helix-turn-helix domain-containing protein [Salinicoccus sp. ID82-1]MCG1010384.1 DNA-binding protein [Salinicoccus sp. ID82-1]
MSNIDNTKNLKEYPYLLTREQASRFLGIDPKSFDKYMRPHEELERFMIGRQERYTINSLIKFIEKQSV